VGNLGGYFSFKKKLIEENSRLKFELEAGKGMVANYRVIFQENQYLKGVLDRKNDKTPLILASILMRPNMSPYDTLIVDIGQNRSLQKGGLVFAYGTIPIGKVAEVYSNTAKIILFSSSGEKTSVVVSNINSENNLEKNISLVALGRGGGNFEIILPRDFSLKEGNEVVLPGINSYLLGRVETIISDPRDPFTKALLVSPVNIQDLKFVEIENP
jgi:cell shape-determining protein MreC